MNWNLKIVNGPKRTQINNGSTMIKGGMPIKELTSTNENHFAMNRHQYVNTNNTETARTAEIIAKKKWLGNSNRDASSIARRNAAHVIGYNSLNPSGNEMSFTASNKNTVNQALQRTRNKGYVVPPKVVKNTNAPIFY